MNEKKLGVSDFARACNMNPGTISGFVNGNRKPSVYQLDRITETLGHPIGYYYEHYISEYLADAEPNWRRMSPFLESCAKLNKLDCIQQVVNMLLDKLGYVIPLFELAEHLFEEHLYEAAAILYENVALTEKKQYSERLSICHYRLFLTRQGEDQQKNYEAAIQFEYYVERLNEANQLDALRALVNTYRSLRKWDKADKFAKVLGYKAEVQYKFSKNTNVAHDEKIKRSFYPAFVYWAFAHLIQAEVCDAKKDYATGFKHIQKYADLSWVQEADETTVKWKNQFKEWACANTFVNRILAGEVSVLPDYVSYFSARKDEILPALDIITEAANQYNINVDEVLQKFDSEITSYMEQQIDEGRYSQRFINGRLIHFSKELSVYYLIKGKFIDGFKFLLSCLEKSTAINNKSYIIKCVKLFEDYSEHASSEVNETYKNLIKEVDEDEE
jgi:transcriptional regulator with XRE-family HTH domain